MKLKYVVSIRFTLLFALANLATRKPKIMYVAGVLPLWGSTGLSILNRSDGLSGELQARFCGCLAPGCRDVGLHHPLVLVTLPSQLPRGW